MAQILTDEQRARKREYELKRYHSGKRKPLTEEQKQRKRDIALKRYYENKDLPKEKEKRHAYYRDKKEYFTEYNKKRYAENRDELQLQRKQWKQRRKELSKTDVDQTFRDMLSSFKCRSKKLGWECNIDLEYLHQLWQEQQGLCKLSNLPMSTELGSKWLRVSPDRIDSNKGYIKGNIQLVRASVNCFKMNMEQDDFISLCKAIAANN